MSATAWVMAMHIVTLGTWSAALLVLASLYAGAPSQHDRTAAHRQRVMCRYVFVMLASPAAVLAIGSGAALAWLRGAGGGWLPAKLTVVALLVLYHAWCGGLLDKQGMESHHVRPKRQPILLVAVPLLLIGTIFVLVLAKPDVMFEYQLTPKPAGHRDEGSAEQRQIQATGGDGRQGVFQTG